MQQNPEILQREFKHRLDEMEAKHKFQLEELEEDHREIIDRYAELIWRAVVHLGYCDMRAGYCSTHRSSWPCPVNDAFEVIQSASENL